MYPVASGFNVGMAGGMPASAVARPPYGPSSVPFVTQWVVAVPPFHGYGYGPPMSSAVPLPPIQQIHYISATGNRIPVAYDRHFSFECNPPYLDGGRDAAFGTDVSSFCSLLKQQCMMSGFTLNGLQTSTDRHMASIVLLHNALHDPNLHLLSGSFVERLATFVNFQFVQFAFTGVKMGMRVKYEPLRYLLHSIITELFQPQKAPDNMIHRILCNIRDFVTVEPQQAPVLPRRTVAPFQPPFAKPLPQKVTPSTSQGDFPTPVQARPLLLGDGAFRPVAPSASASPQYSGVVPPPQDYKWDRFCSDVFVPELGRQMRSKPTGILDRAGFSRFHLDCKQVISALQASLERRPILVTKNKDERAEYVLQKALETIIAYGEGRVSESDERGGLDFATQRQLDFVFTRQLLQYCRSTILYQINKDDLAHPVDLDNVNRMLHRLITEFSKVPDWARGR